MVREATFPVTENEVNFTVYSPQRPGRSYLLGPGLKHRLEFVAASFLQGLIYEWVPTLVYALVLALVLRSYAVASFYIPSGSMENTLFKGDMLIADKLSYKVLGREPKRGDIMIFRFPKNTKLDYIKRLVGLPGDTIEVKDGIVSVNGIDLEEDYIKEKPFSDFGPETVPEGHYFMMGDNRNNSHDSRRWGFVPRKNLEGRALFVFWPPARIHAINNGVIDEFISNGAPQQ
ncbi:signal peptidase I [bacterium]|nr:signal peptidase I [bacterium]